MNQTFERLEILSVALLRRECRLVDEMRRTSEALGIALGWHYLHDLPWAAQELALKPSMRIIDAGAGRGAMQWWLADHGVTVLSVDRRSRANLPQAFRKRYRIAGLRPEDLSPATPLTSLRSFLPPRYPRLWKTYPSKLRAALEAVSTPINQWVQGTVCIYNHDLRNTPEIASNTVDSLVSISALEHNPPGEPKVCVSELMRVPKPTGKLVATPAAARDNDWSHEASKGWCYTEATLRGFFDLPRDCPSNYDRYDQLFEALYSCAALPDNLAGFYFKSGDNGMPWGIWDPKYQPVGVAKVKPLV